MIDFKALFKNLSKAGLVDRPISAFSEVEVKKLAKVFLDTAMKKGAKTCGTCHYQGWKGLDIACLHPDHPCVVSVWQWGMKCKSYSDYAEFQTMGRTRVAPLKEVPDA